MANEQSGTKTVKNPETLTPKELARHLPQQAVVVIEVAHDGQFQIIPDTFFISKQLRGEVLWKLEPADAPYTFTVTFSDKVSPFKSAVFSSANPDSGPVQDVPAPAYYSYTVALEHKTIKGQHGKNSPGKDPGGIVNA